MFVCVPSIKPHTSPDGSPRSCIFAQYLGNWLGVRWRSFQGWISWNRRAIWTRLNMVLSQLFPWPKYQNTWCSPLVSETKPVCNRQVRVQLLVGWWICQETFLVYSGDVILHTCFFVNRRNSRHLSSDIWNRSKAWGMLLYWTLRWTGQSLIIAVGPVLMMVRI